MLEGRSAVVDLDRLDAIHRRVEVPLVVHGGTSFPAEAVDGSDRARRREVQRRHGAEARLPRRTDGGGVVHGGRREPARPPRLARPGRPARRRPTAHDRGRARAHAPVREQRPCRLTSPALYRAMLLIRRFEERVYRLFLDGEIPGTLHQYQGQEAVAVGVCDVLERNDWITSTHRPHGHALAKGVSARAAMAELYGKATGCCRGNGGSMHLGDPDVGMLPGDRHRRAAATRSSPASGSPSSCAAATRSPSASSARERRTRAPSTKDSTSPRCSGCPSSSSARTTSTARRRRYTRVSLRRGRRRSRAGLRRAGADRRRHGRARRARGDGTGGRGCARAGDGPTLLECKTYRYVGHSRSDARGYRTREEEDAWTERDPIVRLRDAARPRATPPRSRPRSSRSSTTRSSSRATRRSPIPQELRRRCLCLSGG